MPNELIIAFTRNTSKKTSKIICRNFRHCCVLFPIGPGNKYTLVQIGIDGVRLCPIDAAAMRRMKKNGWEMIKVQSSKCKVQCQTRLYLNFELCTLNFLTCVGFAKRAIGIRNPFIWTPDQLYRKVVSNK